MLMAAEGSLASMRATTDSLLTNVAATVEVPRSVTCCQRRTTAS
jgi:hypothetical protein